MHCMNNIRGRCYLCECEKDNWGCGEAIWDESEIWLIDGASVKEGLLCHGLKPNFHRYIGQLRRPLPRLQKTSWRRFFVHRCHTCGFDDYVHAKRNG